LGWRARLSLAIVAAVLSGVSCKSSPTRTRAGEDHRAQQAEQITDRDARELSAARSANAPPQQPPPAAQRDRQTELIDVPLRP
jgi:hypothetical protein